MLCCDEYCMKYSWNVAQSEEYAFRAAEKETGADEK